MFGQKFGRKNSLIGGFVSSSKYSRISAAVLRQVKYVYDWLKPSLASRYIELRPRERLGQEDRLRVVALDVADAPLPEGERLGVRVVDAEDRHAVRRSRSGRRRRARPTGRASPRSRSRTGRCPGTSWAGSRRTGWCRRAARRNHSGCSVTHGMVGRCLEGDVERDLDAALARRGDQSIEVGERAELGVDRGVAALGGADRPRDARVVRGLGRAIVGALSELATDRVDRAAGRGRRSPAR